MTGGRTTYGFIDSYHGQRRKQILAAHPNIRELMKIDPSFKYVAGACAITQLFIAYLLADACLINVILMGLTIGTLFDCTLSEAIHEIIHDMAIVGSPLANKWFGGLVNLPRAWPFAGSYYRTHRYHHAFLGNKLDAKYPTVEEALEYDMTFFGRLKYVFMHPLSLDERWERNVHEAPNTYTTWNTRTVYAFDVVIWYFWGYKSLLYLLISFWINDSIFIQGSKNYVDHWVDEKQPHTVSYYGLLNWIEFNIGYHREHHDFPNVPGRYLKQVYAMATEYYSDQAYIAGNVFFALWDILTAEPGKGLIKHANKLEFKQVKLLAADGSAKQYE